LVLGRVPAGLHGRAQSECGRSRRQLLDVGANVQCRGREIVRPLGRDDASFEAGGLADLQADAAADADV